MPCSPWARATLQTYHTSIVACLANWIIILARGLILLFFFDFAILQTKTEVSFALCQIDRTTRVVAWQKYCFGSNNIAGTKKAYSHAGCMQRTFMYGMGDRSYHLGQDSYDMCARTGTTAANVPSSS